ncbi:MULTISPECIES: hypothetical protein [unclassified Campylobacter]|uniref:hypothetical protein n=1 Tax=unclassified Campylobacter TaxID=2593542 RepID=UPI0022E9A1B1|nr:MULTISPECIES: hypothetical protein [unclassified Campylobacter]MDA3061994.1 hypothetical protein [Campylobacter sp. JMF_14 EL1]MDA3072901.1 hypothetical protein [Campylobacter sp. JMF_10 EL2]
MEEIKLGTFTQEDLKEEVGSEEIVNLPQKPKKITLKDIDFSDRNSLLGTGEKVAKPCSFGAREGLAERAKNVFGLFYAVANLGDEKSPALVHNQALSEALGIKIMNTPLDELDEEIAENLINEIRWPYETISKIRIKLATEELHYIEITNNTKLDTSKHPLYAKLQEAIDELNRRGVVFKVSNGEMIELEKKEREILGEDYFKYRHSIKI